MIVRRMLYTFNPRVDMKPASRLVPLAGFIDDLDESRSETSVPDGVRALRETREDT